MDEFARAQIEVLKRRIEELERHVGLQRETPAIDPEIAEKLRAGRMVEAIKLYRDAHDVDLMTAKLEIERIYAEGNFQ